MKSTPNYITGQVPVGVRAAARGSLSSDPSVFSVPFSKIEQVKTENKSLNKENSNNYYY